ncbi:MAG: hypothetical protein WCJ71_08240, partial [Candidatus Omnitrophota bacterium]
MKRAPFLAISGELLLVCVVIMTRPGISKTVKATAFNLLFIVFVFGAFEGYLAWENFNPKHRPLDVLDGDFFDGHDAIRGYSAKKNVCVGAHKTLDGKAVFDVSYSTNQYGLRVSPHDLATPRLNPDYKNVIFFGCSYAFGHGLNDNETLPFAFEDKSHGKYKTYNFAQNAYGPHQMLSILESDLIDKTIVDRKPSIAIYSAILDHVERAAMKLPDTVGPKYRLDHQGKLLRSAQGASQLFLFQQANKSYLFRAARRRFFERMITPGDFKLFVGIVKKAAKIFKEKYNGKFYVIYWDENLLDLDKKIVHELEKEKITIIKVSQIFAQYNSKEINGLEEEYKIKNLSKTKYVHYV